MLNTTDVTWRLGPEKEAGVYTAEESVFETMG
jgi:hypothetical protein